ncbi:FAD binding domain-containing protein [Dactylosporangium sp. CA-092794]|uniref:FAD binding domain-containing protein n=1 Tax=Dactylosporangium sp. CA-092794 TaxID=3239929 RepID=UPI003D8CEC90
MASRPATVHRPTTPAETLALLAEDPEQSKLLAGGTAFTILWRSGLIQAEHIICCTAVSGLDGIRVEADSLVLGALTTLRAAEVSRAVQHHVPVLSSTLRHVANLRVRNVATWGGNVAEADNASDLPAVLVALDAQAVVRSVRGERVSRVQDLIVDFFTTTLAPDEMIVELRIPTPASSSAGSYVKFVSRAGDDRTCMGVAAFVGLHPDGSCRDLRLVAIGAGAVPLRLPDVEAQAVGEVLDERTVAEVAAAYAAAADPLSDVRGSAGYRRRVLPALIAEAVSRASAGDNEAVLL